MAPRQRRDSDSETDFAHARARAGRTCRDAAHHPAPPPHAARSPRAALALFRRPAPPLRRAINAHPAAARALSRSRLVIGSRAELVAALRAQLQANGPAPCHEGGCRCVAGALEERIRALREAMFLDALFLVAQFPGGQIAEADKCCYAFDVRRCAGLCRAAWVEEAFWSGLARVSHPGRQKRTRLM